MCDKKYWFTFSSFNIFLTLFFMLYILGGEGGNVSIRIVTQRNKLEKLIFFTMSGGDPNWC